MSKKINASKIVRWAGLCIGLALFAAFTTLAVMWGWSLRDAQKFEEFQALLNSLGPGGWFILLLIQYLQIVVAVIPGGPLQIAAGVLYGPLGGLLTCLLGNLLATATVFYLVHRFGERVISLFVNPKDVKLYQFLQKDEKRVEMLVVLLFFIPGSPKDALTYLFALTPIKLSRFVLLSTLARIPAILTSVLAGDSISDGKWTKALVMFVIITIISLLGLILHRWIMRVWGNRSRGEKR